MVKMGRKSPDSPIDTAKGWVCLGVITKPKGVRGQVRITSFTGRAGDLVAYGPLFDGPNGRALGVTLRETLKGGIVIAAIDGVTDRDGAEALRGVELHVPREALPEAEDDDYYHADLIGLAVEDADGVAIGSVAALHNFGAGEILEVALPGGDNLMLPFTREVVPEIDIAGGRIVVAPPRETTAEKPRP
jgi:16S rRNA processing protein RimM